MEETEIAIVQIMIMKSGRELCLGFN